MSDATKSIILLSKDSTFSRRHPFRYFPSPLVDFIGVTLLFLLGILLIRYPRSKVFDRRQRQSLKSRHSRFCIFYPTGLLIALTVLYRELTAHYVGGGPISPSYFLDILFPSPLLFADFGVSDLAPILNSRILMTPIRYGCFLILRLYLALPLCQYCRQILHTSLNIRYKSHKSYTMRPIAR